MRTKILLLFTLLFTIANYQVKAQIKQITGSVIDAKTNEPIEGVTVTIVGTKNSTKTNKAGLFTLKVSTDVGELEFSGISYETFKVKYSDQALVVKLSPSTELLGEVVVIGYGTTKKKDLTGSVTAISSKDFVPGNYSTPEQLISGKIAGVSIISNNGAPGSGSTIRIRGGASLNASNDPLIVIDGLILSNDKISGQANPLSLINPNDIETFTVLKDASATAIYGSRGSNGVILITTKKGTSSKLKINFNSQFSIQTIAKKVEVMSGDEIRSIVKQNAPSMVGLLGTANTDWQSQIFQQALAFQNNISLSGNIVRNLPFRLSLDNLNQDGLLKTGNLNRNTVNINLSPRLFQNHLKIDLNVIYASSKTRFANTDAIGSAISFDPTQPVNSGSSRFGGYWEWLDRNSTTGLRSLATRNPVGLLNQRQDNSTVNRTIANATFDYKLHFFPDIRAVLTVGADLAEGTGTNVINDSAAATYKNFSAGNNVYLGGTNNNYKQTRNNSYLNFYLNYFKDIKAINTKIEALAGYEFQDYLTIENNYPDYTYNKIIKTTPAYPIDSPEFRLQSFIGRLNITILDRYLITGTVRSDASSKFSADNRVGIFPSVAIAWNIKNENFLKNSNVVSNLKLRLGYGVTGQQDGIGYYDYLSFYSIATSTASYQFGNNYYQGYRPSGYYLNRTWEQTATQNVAIDFGFLNNRLSGTIEVYSRKTTNLLNNINQPALTNFSNQIIANVGSMTNDGIELTLHANPIKTKDWNWDISFNVAYNENKITQLTISQDPTYQGLRYQGISGGVGNNILIQSVNYNRGSFFVFKQVYDKAGKPIDNLFADLNRDGIINEKDLYQYKGIDPKWIFGFTSNLNYRKWTLGIVIRANLDNYLYNNVAASSGILRNIINPNGFINNGSSDYLQTRFSGSGSNYLFSDYYVQNASFLRVDNINLAYNLGKIINKKVDLSLRANIQNVLIITEYTGLDPESTSGVDNNFYPRPRTFNFGINLNF